MQGRLSRWAVALQEYDFEIKYRKGSDNGNADALSRANHVECHATEVHCGISLEEIHTSQMQDPSLSEVIKEVTTDSPERPCGARWKQKPLKRWLQLWPQLEVVNGVLMRTKTSPCGGEPIQLVVIPPSLQPDFMKTCHDCPSAGHLGYEKTLEWLRSKVYWIGMASDMAQYCDSCEICQRAKKTLPTPAPMVNTPVGKPWEMLAVDVLKVPPSEKGNTYLLVIQDYFTKWLEAIPMKDETADTIINILFKIFSVYGVPRFLHSDQGRNFESTILKHMCEAFGISKTHTTPYHPQGDGIVEQANRSILNLLRSFSSKEYEWEKWLPMLLFAYHTARHKSTPFPPFTLMFGRAAREPLFMSEPTLAFDPQSYEAHLKRKVAEIYDIVDANLVQAMTNVLQVNHISSRMILFGSQFLQPQNCSLHSQA